MQVSLRSLEEADRHNPDFNPVNYLAQYLMRNNPRYSNFAEAHPYCRSMKEVSGWGCLCVLYSMKEVGGWGCLCVYPAAAWR